MPENKDRLLQEVINEDLPGGGHFLCVECSRHFIDAETLRSPQEHKSTQKEAFEVPG